jgi:hypothetical protein
MPATDVSAERMPLVEGSDEEGLLVWVEVDGRMYPREFMVSPADLETWMNEQPFDIPEELRDRLRTFAHPRPDRNTIVPVGMPLETLRDAARDSLQEQNDPPLFYRQGGQVTEVRRDEKHITTLKPVTSVRMKERLAEAIIWENVDGGKIHPPAAAAAVLLETKELYLPPIEMITEIPVLRPDGKFTLHQGYDRLARVYFAPSSRLGRFNVPDRVTRDDVRTAFGWLKKMLGDFPYVDASDHTNLFAFMFTPVVRPVIEGQTPLAAVSAPRPGTGKTLLVESVVRMLIGRPPSTLSFGTDENEAEKRITAHLLKGPQFTFIDNVPTGTKLDSAALARVLTSPVWSGRIIQTSRMPDLPNSATWVATGNNLQMGGEIAQRAYLIELNANEERPRDRDPSIFAVPNLTSWVTAHRVELLTQVLILVRAWTQAGMKRTAEPTLGSFEDWSHVMGGIMRSLEELGGYPAGSLNFLGNEGRKRSEFETEEVDQTAMFLELALEVMGDANWSCRELLHAQHPRASLMQETLPNGIDSGSEGAARKLGTALRTVSKGTYGGYSVQNVGRDNHRGGSLWQVSGTVASS